MKSLTCDRSEIISTDSGRSDGGQKNKNKSPQSRVNCLPDVTIAWILSHAVEPNR